MKLTSKEKEMITLMSSLTANSDDTVREVVEALFSSFSMLMMKDVNISKKTDGRSIINIPYFGELTLDYKSIPPKNDKDGYDVDLDVKFKPSRHMYNEVNHIIHRKEPPTWKKCISKFKRLIDKDLIS